MPSAPLSWWIEGAEGETSGLIMRQEIVMASAKQKDAVEMLKIAAKNVKDQKTQKAISEALGDGKGQKSAKAPKAAPVASQKEQKATQKVVAKSNGKFENPYREGTNYWALTAILAKSIGKYLDCETIMKAVPSVMGANWKAFKNREGRNENAKDVEGRLCQNLDVIRRCPEVRADDDAAS